MITLNSSNLKSSIGKQTAHNSNKECFSTSPGGGVQDKSRYKMYQLSEYGEFLKILQILFVKIFAADCSYQ